MRSVCGVNDEPKLNLKSSLFLKFNNTKPKKKKIKTTKHIRFLIFELVNKIASPQRRVTQISINGAPAVKKDTKKRKTHTK